MHRKIAGTLAGRRSKWVVLACWILLLIIFGMFAGKLQGATTNTSQSYLPGSAEATRVLNQQGAFLSENTATAVVVYERASGLTPADLAKAHADAGVFGQIKQLDGKVLGPIPSKDHLAIETIVPLNLGANGWTKASSVVDSILATARTSPGLAVHVTGPAGIAADSSKAFEGIDGKLLYLTLAAVILILLIAYRSPLLWFFPILSAVAALGVTEGIIYLLVKHTGLTVNSETTGILTVLVIGAGTDYALLLIARYREELRRHEDRHEAMAVALHRAGPAIFASSGTVVAGLLCLLIAETNSTRGLGPVCAIGVFVALLAMLTLLPALLVIFGRRIFWPFRPLMGTPEPTTQGLWAKVGLWIAPRPRKVWVATSVILALASLGILGLNATGLTTNTEFTTTQDSVVGQDLLAAHFDAGAGNPAVILANAAQASIVEQATRTTDGVASVEAPLVRDGTAFIQAQLVDAPDSQGAYDTVDRLRDRLHAIPEADALVGGAAAINLDVQRAARHDNVVVIPLVLAVVLLILGLLLRAVVAPVVLIATVVLSFGAALGLSALLFRHVLGFAGADGSLPLFVFVFLVALGIDYNIFLMTRVREEAAKFGTRRGAVIAVGATGGVITSAGCVLAATFSVLATLPLVAFAEIGFAVALGVLLDTIVVRSVLVTALNLDLGRHMWWPSALGRKEDVATDGLPQREAVFAD